MWLVFLRCFFFDLAAAKCVSASVTGFYQNQSQSWLWSWLVANQSKPWLWSWLVANQSQLWFDHFFLENIHHSTTDSILPSHPFMKRSVWKCITAPVNSFSIFGTSHNHRSTMSCKAIRPSRSRCSCFWRWWGDWPGLCGVGWCWGCLWVSPQNIDFFSANRWPTLSFALVVPCFDTPRAKSWSSGWEV